MKTYVVFRVEYLTNKKIPIGTLVDRRQKERRNNVEGMLRLAQKVYVTSSIDSHIFISPE